MLSHYYLCLLTIISFLKCTFYFDNIFNSDGVLSNIITRIDRYINVLLYVVDKINLKETIDNLEILKCQDEYAIQASNEVVRLDFAFRVLTQNLKDINNNDFAYVFEEIARYGVEFSDDHCTAWLFSEFFKEGEDKGDIKDLMDCIDLILKENI